MKFDPAMIDRHMLINPIGRPLVICANGTASTRNVLTIIRTNVCYGINNYLGPNNTLLADIASVLVANAATVFEKKH